MPDFVDDGAEAGAESRVWRRLRRSFVSTDSYGLVLLVAVTYVVSVSVTETRAASIVLTIQLARLWLFFSFVTMTTVGYGNLGTGRQSRADLRRA